MDRDFDGRLTFEEFMGEESTIEKLFKNMDKNGDGVVTKEVGHVSHYGQTFTFKILLPKSTYILASSLYRPLENCAVFLYLQLFYM